MIYNSYTIILSCIFFVCDKILLEAGSNCACNSTVRIIVIQSIHPSSTHGKNTPCYFNHYLLLKREIYSIPFDNVTLLNSFISRVSKLSNKMNSYKYLVTLSVSQNQFHFYLIRMLSNPLFAHIKKGKD